MARTLDPPSSLTHLRWFIVRYEREFGTYQVAVPTTRETYLLGDEEKTRAYFVRAGVAAVGHRAMDAARSFGAAQALVKEGRAWALDLIDPRIGGEVAEKDRVMLNRRLLADPADDEDEALIL